MAQINKVNVSDTTYDISQSPDATFTATSNDNASPISWTDVAVLASGETNSSIFGKISSMFKNIRFLYSKLGTSDFSSVGNTVSAALAALQTNKASTATFTSATAGLVPAAKSGTTNYATTGYVLTGAGWQAGTKYNTDNNTTYAAATTAAAGLMPALNGNSAMCLLGDGTWGTAGSTYANVSTTAPGLAPTLSGTATQYLNGNGEWTTPPDNNTTYAAGVGLGLSGTQFYCSTPRVTQDANTQLNTNTYKIEEVSNSSANLPSTAWYFIINMKGDDNSYQAQLALGETVDAAYYRSCRGGTWGSWRSIINTDTNTTYANFKSGSAGLVPAPSAAQATTGYVLTGAGWAAGTKYNTDTTYALSTSTSNGLMSATQYIYLSRAYQDTGVKTLNSTYGITYRRFGTVVTVYCWKNTNLNIAAATNFGTLPVGCRPTETVYVACYSGGESQTRYVQIAADGSVKLGSLAITNSSLLFHATFVATGAW